MTSLRIAELVPQQGSMCLLEEIVSCDERRVICRTASHRSPDNPLRCDGRLPAIAGIEYGAQAMAVHGALNSALTAQDGLLAGARAVRCNARYLDEEPGPLTVRAERLVAEGGRLLYSFVVEGAQAELVSGRIAVVLAAAPPAMKRALVSGGSGEIGAAICRTLSAGGWEVIVHARSNPGRAAALAGELTAAGGRAQSVSFDVVDAAATAGALAELLAAGPIQGVVHNAGIHDDAPMAGMNAKQWHDVIGVSLHGFFNLVQPLLLPMLRTRWGRIVALSSVSGVIGNRGQANYAAAKAGLDGAMRSLSLEIASRGVTVNSVAPGIIETAMSKGVFDAARIAQLVPMKRAGTAAEVAGLVGYLMSEGAGYITGQVISVNGGMA